MYDFICFFKISSLCLNIWAAISILTIVKGHFSLIRIKQNDELSSTFRAMQLA